MQQALEYRRIWEEGRRKTPGNVALHGFKVYSQHDEDGIISTIFNRIKGGRTFIEIGVQDGTECNSLNLLLNDWRGVWVEADRKQVNKISSSLGGHQFATKFKVVQEFVDLGNISAVCDSCLSFLGVKEVDLFSLDIDGNDLHIVERLLERGFKAKVFCVEYNGKFPPPMELSVRYDSTHIWDGTDYQGASLQSFVNLFQKFGYQLLTCNLVGVNAFFVRSDYIDEFEIYTIEELYQPCRYYLSPMISGHKPSLRYLKNKLTT